MEEEGTWGLWERKGRDEMDAWVSGCVSGGMWVWDMGGIGMRVGGWVFMRKN